MGNRVTNAAVIAACSEMLGEDISYDDLDCQAAVEEAYFRAGLERSSVNLAGSNAHYRKCYWTGTPERLCEIIGTKNVPNGCETYIVEDDGGEPAKYQGDSMGNASHMGIYMGDEQTFNSSEKMGGVVISEKFDGHNAVPNGGWDAIGLKGYVNYGLSDEQLEAIMNDGNFAPKNYPDDVDNDDAENGAESAGDLDVSKYYAIKKGCKGGAVKRLQEWLNELGYGLKVDHDFGDKTEKAVLAFQEENGLDMDGVVGQQTWRALADQIA